MYQAHRDRASGLLGNLRDNDAGNFDVHELPFAYSPRAGACSIFFVMTGQVPGARRRCNGLTTGTRP